MILALSTFGANEKRKDTNQFTSSTTETCSTSYKENGGGFSTRINSVTYNENETYTIEIEVSHDGCSGKDCKELSHFSIEVDETNKFTNVSWNSVTGTTTGNIELSLGNNDPFDGFKLDNVSGIGDGKAGSFTITYTIENLQNQQFLAKAGNDYTQIASFTVAEFNTVRSCFSEGTITNEPFNCVYSAYLFQHGDIYAVNLASGSSILVKENIVDTKINAAAYNSADGYLWGYVKDKPKTLIRIGKDFETEEYTIPSIPDAGQWSFVGDINLEGMYYYKMGSSVFKVDLNPESENYLTFIETFDLPKNINNHDWAFNAADNMLYTVERGSNHLYKIDVSTNTTIDLGEIPILAGNNYTYGAVYFDVDGNFYISANQTGTIYRVKAVHTINAGGSMDSNLFAFGPASGSNDGARCPTAPVPDEDCSNGLDDDGDGLVDCDDPACSGVAACPVITPVTPGNDGGLESNNRLSEKINTRNYFRKRRNYSFNVSKAPTFKPVVDAIGSGIESIEDFIPTKVLENTVVKESTPLDLLNLTNAINILSVDYVNNEQETVASILALETHNAVYEHTKYICDRLLGGQILGINTFMINEETFIKTTIKNPGGEVEHVLSFSVQDKGDSFGIESHWNLDKYSNVDFFNYQIWSNSVDDLYKLAAGIIENFKTVKPISSYNNSTPPSTYVRSGYYKNGKLYLNITNTNNSTNLHIKGGIRETETSDTEAIDTNVSIDGYSSVLEFNSGSLFDFGFRIESNKGGTPDDIFIADGAWGVDDSSYNTSVVSYEITPNTEEADENTFLVERNIKISAKTEHYISVYKAFTPRFRAIDLSEYNTLKLSAEGTGEMTIIIMRDDVSNWEEQHKYTFSLNNELTTREISLKDFKNNKNESIDVSKVTSIVFQQEVAKIGVEETKEMHIENIQFNYSENQIINETSANETVFTQTIIQDGSTIEINSLKDSTYKLTVMGVNGKTVQSLEGNIYKGANSIPYTKPTNTTGIYFYEVEITNGKTYTGKLIFAN
ncbi:DUF6923 family protein [Wenyingzhuangia sp. IMCC45574]